MTTDSRTETSQRHAHWIDQVREAYSAVEVSASLNSALRGTLTFVNLPGLRLSCVRSDAQHLVRSVEIAAADPEHALLVLVQTTGQATLAQDGREVQLTPGDFAICDNTRPFTLDFAGRFEQLVLTLRGDRTRSVIGRTDALTATVMPTNQGAGNLLIYAVRYLCTQLHNLAPLSAAAAVDSVIYLLFGALHTLRPAVDPTVSSISSQHLARIKQFIDDRLSDPRLTIESVAAELGISEGHLHRVFKAEPISPSQYLWARRLEACGRALLDPQQTARPVAEIARAWGFRSSPHFSRAFRERFGHSPSEWRRQVNTDARHRAPALLSPPSPG